MKLRLSPGFYRMAACGLVLLAVVRIVSTYHVFNQTYDEPFHIASGMEWLDQGTYHYDTEDPVLANIAVAVGPYLDGSRSMGQPTRLAEGNAILYGSGHYFRTLSLARAGILPFFLLACAVLWFWCRRLFGEEVALAALFLFTTLPPVLAHAGLATTDMAGYACLLAAIYACTRWAEEPTWLHSLLFGLCAGLAFLAKLSNLLFVPLSAAAILCLYALAERPPARSLLKRLATLALSVPVVCLLIWAGYRFSFGTIPEHAYFATQPQVTIDRFLGGVRLPAPEFFDGIATVQLHNYQGHPAWCLGKYHLMGFWYFFPVALGVKTPIAFLLLSVAGLAVCFRYGRSKRFAWQRWVPGVCAALILLCVIPTHINIGLRHILILYPLLAIPAGVAAVTLLRHGSKAALLGGLLLLFWQGFVSFRAQPDYLAYFNEFVRGDPAYVLCDSDLDWGQDLQRLSQKLKAVGAKQVTLIYFGSADVNRHGLPPIQYSSAYKPTTGWVALSAFARTIMAARIERDLHRSDSPLGWLDRYRPVAHIGKSIDLYYIPPK